MSGDPASALTTGSVIAVSSNCGLRGHFVYTTICGSEMSGMASSDAVRTAYTLRSTPAPTSAQTTAFQRMTALMTLMIIRPGPGRPLFCPLQFVLGVDEETAE